MASFSSGFKKEGGQPSSPAASVAGTPTNTGRIPCTGTAAAAAATRPASLLQSNQNASALPRAIVTGTSALGLGTGGSRDRLVGGSAAAEVGGSGARDTSGVAAGVGGGAGGEGGRRDGGGALDPAQEAMRRMIVHINTLDPYPCVLGIPVKPALFATSKVYVFVCFSVISVKLMYDVITGTM